MSAAKPQFLDWRPVALASIEFYQKKTHVFWLPRRAGKTALLQQVHKAGTAAGCVNIVELRSDGSSAELAGADLLLVDDLEKLEDGALARLKALCGTIPIVAVLTPLDEQMKWKDGAAALPAEHLHEHHIKCFAD
jgi:hypothetical protein